jgi:hypothetical protein
MYQDFSTACGDDCAVDFLPLAYYGTNADEDIKQIVS